jgi:hypothetical protein
MKINFCLCVGALLCQGVLLSMGHPDSFFIKLEQAKIDSENKNCNNERMPKPDVVVQVFLDTDPNVVGSQTTETSVLQQPTYLRGDLARLEQELRIARNKNYLFGAVCALGGAAAGAISMGILTLVLINVAG